MQCLEVSGAIRHTHTHTHTHIYIYIYIRIYIVYISLGDRGLSKRNSGVTDENLGGRKLGFSD
jgi:hypothetical protein